MKKNTVTGRNGITDYRAAQAQHQQALRRGILDDASNLLMQEGSAALSMRRIAQLVGCSTTVLYTMFGSKRGLVDQLYLRGFEMICQALEVVPHPGTTRDYVSALCEAYRQFALENSTYYAVMFANSIPEYAPSDSSRELGQDSFRLLVQAVQDCISPEPPQEESESEESEREAWEIARIIWANLHGHVSLELAGYFDYPGVVPEQMLARSRQALIDQLLPVRDESS